MVKLGASTEVYSGQSFQWTFAVNQSGFSVHPSSGQLFQGGVVKRTALQDPARIRDIAKSTEGARRVSLAEDSIVQPR